MAATKSYDGTSNFISLLQRNVKSCLFWPNHNNSNFLKKSNQRINKWMAKAYDFEWCSVPCRAKGLVPLLTHHFCIYIPFSEAIFHYFCLSFLWNNPDINSQKPSICPLRSFKYSRFHSPDVLRQQNNGKVISNLHVINRLSFQSLHTSVQCVRALCPSQALSLSFLHHIFLWFIYVQSLRLL